VELGFGIERGPALAKVELGARVFKTLDPALDKRLRASFSGEKARRRASAAFTVRGRAGEPLSIEVEDDLGHRATARSAVALEPALTKPLSEAQLREQLGRLGASIFELGALSVDLSDPLMLPVSELNRMRRALVAELEAAREAKPGWTLEPGAIADALVSRFDADPDPGDPTVAARPARLSVLARSELQVEAALEEGVERIYLDFLELVGLQRAVDRVKEAGRAAIIATPRIGKPNEEAILRRLLALRPAGLLARHLGAIETIFAARESGDAAAEALLLIGDFSLNATNALTARMLLARGLELLTPSYDLDEAQLLALVGRTGAARFEVVIHHHLPIFHMEHCVFAALLSNGHDYRDCGRPCEHHALALRDRLGQTHPVLADVGCRNTVFTDRPQSAASLVDRFQAAGLTRFRLELLGEDKASARATISRYREILAGRASAREVAQATRARDQFGVTARPLPILR
jgi:putative protease